MGENEKFAVIDESLFKKYKPEELLDLVSENFEIDKIVIPNRCVFETIQKRPEVLNFFTGLLQRHNINELVFYDTIVDDSKKIAEVFIDFFGFIYVDSNKHNVTGIALSYKERINSYLIIVNENTKFEIVRELHEKICEYEYREKAILDEKVEFNILNLSTSGTAEQERMVENANNILSFDYEYGKYLEDKYGDKKEILTLDKNMKIRKRKHE